MGRGLAGGCVLGGRRGHAFRLAGGGGASIARGWVHFTLALWLAGVLASGL